LGPFHEKEGSYYAIKEIWAPVRFEMKDITHAFEGSLNLENRYFYTNLNQCTFRWKLAVMTSPDGKTARKEISGEAAAPNIFPGQKGQLKLDLPANWNNYDVLYVTSFSPDNREIFTWSWPIALHL
jgi:hypothetical protein